MTDTKRLQELDHRHIWHPFTQMKDWTEEPPVVINRGEGVWLYDTEGNRYLDGVASMWTNVHGHCRREINEALKNQVDRLEHSTLLGLANEPSILLAERLAGILPDGLSRIFYSDNGSTAVEVGLKMAFQYHQHLGGENRKKTKFIAFSHSYHGDTIGAVSVGGIDIFHEVFRPLLFKTIQAPAPYCYRCPLGMQKETCGLACLTELERMMQEHRAELAGLVIEPLLQGAGGMIVHPEGFLAGVRHLCDKYNILLIADEVAVGFGRTGTMFACEREGVVPDIMALSKGLTAGYMAMAVTVTTEKVYAAFLGEYRELKTFFHGHTFTGNPLGCSIALASLDLFEKDNLLPKVVSATHHLQAGLERLKGLSHVGEVRQCGLAAGIELVADKDTRAQYDWERKVGVRVCQEARKHGLFLRPLGSVIVIFPPLCISNEEIDFLLQGVAASISSVTEDQGG